MPGLLDGRGGFDDPLTMGLLGASQAFLTPVSQGGGLGAAFGAFPAAQQAAEQRRMRELLQMAQMGNLQSETEYRNAQMATSREEAMRKARLEADRSALFGEIAAQGMPTFRDWSSEITGVKPTADYVRPQDRRLVITPQLAARAAMIGIKPEELTAVFDAGRPEVARTIEGRGPDGSPQTMQYDKFGRIVGDGIAKPVEMRFLNTGGSQVAYDPFKGLTGLSIANTMTPGEVASNQVARDRLNIEAQGKRQYDPARGIYVDPVTGNATAVMMNGQPIGEKPKDANEGQTNAFLYANRATAANDIIASLGKKPSVTGAGLSQSAENLPLVGGAAGGIANWMLSRETQQYLQAQRDFINAVLRKESGAAIGQSEFDNARKQYFPQAGDDDAVIQQKAENRARAIEGISAGAGPLESRIPKPVAATTQSAVKPQSGLGTQSVSGPVLGPRDTKPAGQSGAQMSPENIKHTARLYNITEEEVVRRLNEKR